MAGRRITSSTEGSWRKSSDCMASFMQGLCHEKDAIRGGQCRIKGFTTGDTEEHRGNRMGINSLVHGTFPGAFALQSVEIGEQILNILRVENLAVAGHVRTAVANDVGDAVVVSGQSAEGKVLVLEDAF